MEAAGLSHLRLIVAQESGFYYLQSRYYDPSIGRFINADCFVTTGQGFTGYNMFAYCLNNPVMYKDTSGTSVLFATLIATAVAEILFGVCVSVLLVVAVVEISTIIAQVVYQYSPAKKTSSSKNDVNVKSVSTPAAPEPPDNNNKNKRKPKNDGTPKNNQRQNKQIDDICRKYKLDKDQRRQLHQEISHKNYGYHEIEEIAKWIAYVGRW